MINSKNLYLQTLYRNGFDLTVNMTATPEESGKLSVDVKKHMNSHVALTIDYAYAPKQEGPATYDGNELFSDVPNSEEVPENMVMAIACEKLGLDVHKTSEQMRHEEALMKSAQHVPKETTLTFEESNIGFSFPDKPQIPGSDFISVAAYNLDENGDRGPSLDSAISFKPGPGQTNHTFNAAGACAKFINDEISVCDVESVQHELNSSSQYSRDPHYAVISEEAGIGFSFPDADKWQLGNASTYQIHIHDLTEDGELGPEIDVMNRYTPDEGMVYPDAIRACAEEVTERLAEQNQELGEEQQNQARLTFKHEESGLGFSFPDASAEEVDSTYEIQVHELTEDGELGKVVDSIHSISPDGLEGAERITHEDAAYSCAAYVSEEKGMDFDEVMDQLSQNEGREAPAQGQDLEPPLELRFSRDENKSHTPNGNPRYDYSLRIGDDEYQGKYVGYESKGQIRKQAMQDHPSIAGEIQNAVVKHDDLKVYGAENYRGKEEDRPQDTDISVTMRRAEDRSHTPSGVPRWEYTAEFQGDKVSGKANGYEGPDIDNAIAKKLQKDFPQAMEKAEGITLKEEKVNVHKPEKASKKEQKKEEGLTM